MATWFQAKRMIEKTHGKDWQDKDNWTTADVIDLMIDFADSFKLKNRSDKIEFLDKFCMWAEKECFLDANWSSDKIDEFLKKKP